MTVTSVSEAAKAVVRRNTEEVQGGGDYALYDQLFADDFVDHTPQPGRTPDKAGALELYEVLRGAFPDFHAVIHWQAADGNLVTTYKTYHGTHEGEFFGIAPTGKVIQFETVDAMRVVDGRITEHWGVANLFSLMEQLGPGPAGDEPRASAETPVGQRGSSPASRASSAACTRFSHRSFVRIRLTYVFTVASLTWIRSPASAFDRPSPSRASTSSSRALSDSSRRRASSPRAAACPEASWSTTWRVAAGDRYASPAAAARTAWISSA